MPVQTYDINIKGEVAGQLYGMQQSRAQIDSGKITVAAVGFGVAVKKGAGDREVAAGQAGANLAIYGITLKQQTLESDFRPNTGAVLYPVGFIAPILRDGYVNVIAQDAVANGGAVYVNSTTGLFFGAAAAGRVKASNCVWDVTVGAGAVGRVILTLAVQTLSAPLVP
jgi:hypothetical protein